MKKILWVLVVLSLMAPVVAFAEETGKTEMPGMAMSDAEDMPMADMGMMCCRMKKPQLVATAEGGVIVLAGNKLMKYDANLALVKEVEVKMPECPMAGKQCPMAGKVAAQAAASVTADPQA